MNAIATRPSTWQPRALAIVAALIVNVVILVLGRATNGEYPVAAVNGDDQTIKFAQVIVVTAIVGLIAWGLLALLERTMFNAKALWTIIALVIFVISLLGPLGSGDNASSKIVLACMHAGAAATIIPLMRSTITPRP